VVSEADQARVISSVGVACECEYIRGDEAGNSGYHVARDSDAGKSTGS
jgi:hypothetical protein